MKKTLKILLIISLVILVFPVWYYESRSFYCIDKNQCVTLWKRWGGKCYVIPYKYYSLFEPNDDDNCIITSNANTGMTLYWSDKFPGKVIVNAENKNVEIKNNIQSLPVFVNYTDSISLILYGEGEKKINEVKNGVNFIDLFIDDNWAMDKNGKRL